MVSNAIFSRLCPVASATALNHMQRPSRRSQYCPATTVQCRLQPLPPAASSFTRTTCARPRLTRSSACSLRSLSGSRCQRPSLVPHAQALASCSTACLLGSPSGATEIYFRAFREKSFAVLSEILIRQNCRWFPPPPLHSSCCPEPGYVRAVVIATHGQRGAGC